MAAVASSWLPRTMEIRYGERYILALYGISLQNIKEQIRNHFELHDDLTVQIGIERMRGDGRLDFVEITSELWDYVWDMPDVQNVVARTKEKLMALIMDEGPVRPEFLDRSTVPPPSPPRSVVAVAPETESIPLENEVQERTGEKEKRGGGGNETDSSLSECESVPPLRNRPQATKRSKNAERPARDAANLPTPPSSSNLGPSAPVKPTGPKKSSPAKSKQGATKAALIRSPKGTFMSPIARKKCALCTRLKVVCKRPANTGAKPNKDGLIPCLVCKQRRKKCELEEFWD
ncbi:hypothetical protein FRC17_001981 [Serendipita sp. 399]|nr:hypothetical protein FRC17_001981 [Serendipita sp. 399]